MLHIFKIKSITPPTHTHGFSLFLCSPKSRDWGSCIFNPLAVVSFELTVNVGNADIPSVLSKGQSSHLSVLLATS